MKNEEALEIIGGLSKPSKMPWYSWSTSAFECQVGSKLREIKGSTCESCYATKGTYRFSNVKAALERRLKALSNPLYVQAFISLLTNLYAKTKTYRAAGVKENRFRWHDSGDIQGVDHLDKIVEIAKLTPFINHWLPTREYGMVKQWLKEHPEGFPDNLTVRMSAVMIGTDMTSRPMGLPSSTVDVERDGLWQCPAYKQGGMCKSCDSCWDKTKDVNYPKH